MEKKESNIGKFINREFWGMALTVFTVFSLICLIAGETLFFPVGDGWAKIVLGVFGYAAFPIMIFLMLCGIMLIIGKKVIAGKGVTIAVACGIFAFTAVCILQLAVNPISGRDLGEYLAYVWNLAQNGLKDSSMGGVVFAFFDWLLARISVVGAFIVLSLIALLSLFIMFKDKIISDKSKPEEEKPVPVAETTDNGGETAYRPYTPEVSSQQSQYAAPQAAGTQYGTRRKTLVVGGKFEVKTPSDYSAESARKKYEETFGAGKPVKGESYGDSRNRDYGEKLEYVKTPIKITPEDLDDEYTDITRSRGKNNDFETKYESGIDETAQTGNTYIPPNYTQAVRENPPETNKETPLGYGTGDEVPDLSDMISPAEDDENDVVNLTSLQGDVFGDRDDGGSVDEIVDLDAEEPVAEVETPEPFVRQPDYVKPEPAQVTSEPVRDVKETVSGKPDESEKKEDYNPYDHIPYNFRYNIPPTSIFREYSSGVDYTQLEYFKNQKAEVIVETLKALAGIDVNVVKVVQGPTVTRFELDTPRDVSVKNVMKYELDLNVRLATKNGIRLSQVPGTPYTAVEVPNDKPSIVGLRSVLESDAFKNAKRDSLTFAIGKDVVGNPVVADIAKMPHLLIAGSTGTGKSVGLNALIVSLMMKYSPTELRFVIVDPKQVEFTVFSGIPHMLFDEIIYDAPKTVAMLNWAVKEMETRYTLLNHAAVRNIDEYNDQIDPRVEKRLPRIVIIVDEFADLMSVDKKGISDCIARLSAKARAAGIHLILATQRPDVKTIDGTIKSNITSRMAFKVSNGTNSSIILDELGAEKLLGRGDLLYKMSYMSNMERAQGAFVDTPEIKQFVAYIKEHNESYFNEAAQREIDAECNPPIESIDGKDIGERPSGAVTDEYINSLRLAVQLGYISISLLQRKMSFGFPKAAKIFDWMESEGYVVASQTGKQKQVVFTKEQFEAKYGPL